MDMQVRFMKELNKMRHNSNKAYELLEVYSGYHQLRQALKLGIKMDDPIVQAQLAILRQRVRLDCFLPDIGITSFPLLDVYPFVLLTRIGRFRLEEEGQTSGEERKVTDGCSG